MKKLTALLLSLLLVLSLAASGGSSKAAIAEPQAAPVVRGDYAMEEMAMEAPAAMDTASNSLRGTGETGSTALPENRKWVITVNMEAETEDLDGLMAGLDDEITALAGYVEDQEIYNGSSYASRRHRYANLTVRVPADRVTDFTQAVSGIANVVSTNISRDDITLQYVDTESRVTALQTEESRLLELLAQAQTMSDLLEIEARLSDVRYELESYSSRLRVYDNQVDYATIYLFISEVQEYTPVAEKTVWERIRDGFSETISDVADGAVDLFVWVAVNSPRIAIWAVVIVVIVVLVRAIKPKVRKKAKKAPPKEETGEE